MHGIPTYKKSCRVLDCCYCKENESYLSRSPGKLWRSCTVRALIIKFNILKSFYHLEIVEGLGENPYCKYIVFMSCTRYYPPDDGTEYHAKDAMKYVKGHTALGGGNMALFGTGSLHTWASDLCEVTKRFTDQRIIDGRKFFDDSCGRFVKFSLSNG